MSRRRRRGVHPDQWISPNAGVRAEIGGRIGTGVRGARGRSGLDAHDHGNEREQREQRTGPDGRR